MIFTAKKIHPHTANINLLLNGDRLEVVNYYKYLGVILDNNLTFERHIKSIHKTVSFRTYQLSCLKIFLTIKMALNIYKTTILPHFDYADIIYMNALIGHIAPLQIDQNRCLKICLRQNRLAHTDFIQNEAKLPLLSSRRYMHLLNYMYMGSRDPFYVDEKNILTRAHTGPLVKVTRSNGVPYERSVEYQGAVCWNALPPPRRNAINITTFKAQSRLALEAMVPMVVV